MIQNVVRGFLARRKVTYLRRERAAVSVQAQVRGWLVRLRYKRLQRLALRL